ncbi:MAG: PAS domain S-box protein [Alphaproteobacteria bacterium]|nr:MAG: PAS domain S-box protein [Alphaproteobacteria bacterium]
MDIEICQAMPSIEPSSADQQLIANVLAAIADATAVFDQDSRLVGANTVFLALWGFSSEADAHGTRFADLWQNEQAGASADQSLLLGGAWSSEIVGRRASGDDLRVHIALRRIREAKQLPDYRFVSFMDLSARSDVITALQESEQRFHDMSETVSDLIMEMNEDGDITYLSAPYSPTGRGLDLQVGSNYADAVVAYIDKGGTISSGEEGKRLFEGHEPFADFRTEFSDPDGRRTVLLGSGIPKFDGDGIFRGYRTAQRDITNITRREEALARSEMRLQGIMDNALVGLATVNYMGIIETFNTEAERIFGYSSDQMIGKNLSLLMPEADRERNAVEFIEFQQTGSSEFYGRGPQERTGLRCDGSTFPMELAIGDMVIGGRRTFIGSFYDISEKKEAERKYQQAQKMEAVGQMTGGIAHDFNNLLGALALNLEMLSLDSGDDPSTADLIDALSATIQRGSSLTQRLLSFSRQQVLEIETLNINDLIGDLTDLLVRTIPANIQIKTQLETDLWQTSVDAHQLENAILNLCLNAKDAMPEGGTLTIESRNCTIGPVGVAGFDDMSAGDYVELTLTDTGTGIPSDMIERVVEPFFTTKAMGKGTGLGLSMVYGFVRQSGGHLNITSIEGNGTVIKMHFPKSDAIHKPRASSEHQSRTGTIEGLNILIVEDDPDIQKVLLKALVRKGCQAFAAANGPEALAWLNTQPRGLDLLLTDIVLPGGMNGTEIADKVQENYPNCATIFMSGYLDDEISNFDALSKESNFLTKPFTLAQLTQLMKDVLFEDEAA